MITVLTSGIRKLLEECFDPVIETLEVALKEVLNKFPGITVHAHFHIMIQG